MLMQHVAITKQWKKEGSEIYRDWNNTHEKKKEIFTPNSVYRGFLSFIDDEHEQHASSYS